jgi:hypothetical protein
LNRRTKIIPQRSTLLGSTAVKPLSSLSCGAAVLLASSVALATPASTSPEEGYDLGTIQGPRAIGMGGALNALGTSTEAMYLNPANLPLSRNYHFELLGSYMPEAQRYTLGGAVVDSSSSRLAGGFAGAGSCQDCFASAGLHRNITDIRLAVAYPFGTIVSIGGVVRYLHVDQGTSIGPFGQSLASDGTPNGALLSTFTVDAGITVTPTPRLRFGLVGHNLTDPGTGLAPSTLAGGVGYQGGIFALEADLLGDFTTYGHPEARIMAGGEVFLGQHVPLRLGYRYDDGSTSHAVFGGIGYIAKQWGVEFSGGGDVYSPHTSLIFGLGVRYFYDSSGLGNNQAAEPDSF